MATTPDESALIDAYAHLMDERGGQDFNEATADAARALTEVKRQVWDAAFNAGFAVASAQCTGQLVDYQPNPYRDSGETTNDKPTRIVVKPVGPDHRRQYSAIWKNTEVRASSVAGLDVKLDGIVAPIPRLFEVIVDA